MLVKFKNAEVPVWKLRKGVVVGIENHYFTMYAYIDSLFIHEYNDHSVSSYKPECAVSIIVGKTSSKESTKDLIWLEP